jgi:glycosyltransferase involved in cell wall biosynthesis
LFLALAASWVSPYPRVVWHVHFGKLAAKEKTSFLYLLPVRRLKAVIAVSEPLADWVTKRLFVPRRKVWYIPNFVAANTASAYEGLPGQPGSRIVCVANLREQKDHMNLLGAMKTVVEEAPAAHLILLGDAKDPVYRERILGEIAKRGLEGHVTWLGPRSDVPAILKGCDIGVLGSNSEGLPLALIEYGMAGLAAVSTRVGQCEEVLDNGKAGLLVDRSEPGLLGNAILSLLKSLTLRADLGNRLFTRVQEMYSKETIIQKFCDVYDRVLEVDPMTKEKR